MMTNWMRKPATLGLSLGATLMAAVFGCGGQATDSSDAVVVPDSTATPRPSAAPAAGTPTDGHHADSRPRCSDPGAAAPVKAEGFGTLKGQVVFAGDPPAAKVLFEKGKAAKDPEVCAKDAPLLSERLVVDGATKGVKNVLVYLNKPTSVSDDAKKAYAATPSHVRPDQVRLRAPRPGHHGRHRRSR